METTVYRIENINTKMGIFNAVNTDLVKNEDEQLKVRNAHNIISEEHRRMPNLYGDVACTPTAKVDILNIIGDNTNYKSVDIYIHSSIHLFKCAYFSANHLKSFINIDAFKVLKDIFELEVCEIRLSKCVILSQQIIFRECDVIEHKIITKEFLENWSTN